MPPKTTVPRARWLADPAPKATRRGTTPRMKANEVMTMGRNRLRVASIAASSMDMPPWWRSRANSTISMAFLLARAIMRMSPT